MEARGSRARSESARRGSGGGGADGRGHPGILWPWEHENLFIQNQDFVTFDASFASIGMMIYLTPHANAGVADTDKSADAAYANGATHANDDGNDATR